jgi:predicted DNA-binding transcriptional regulator YafY
MYDHAPTLRHLILLRVREAWRYGMSIKEMANELAVGIRTIRRDLQRLACIGIPFVGINRERNDTVLRSTAGNHGKPRPVASHRRRPTATCHARHSTKRSLASVAVGQTAR